jgi:hypothetical protein
MQQQAETAPALFSAIQLIGDADVSEFAFLCHGATHQSVACSLLLAAIAAAYYPRADRYYLTRRRGHVVMPTVWACMCVPLISQAAASISRDALTTAAEEACVAAKAVAVAKAWRLRLRRASEVRWQPSLNCPQVMMWLL